MFVRLKKLLGGSSTRPVFVIGTGRSGTHWLGYSLGDHPEVRATVETQPMFGLATGMALNPALETEDFPKLVRAYRRELFRSPTRVYVDKSHPNIWLAEKLKDAFPDALFLGIERDPYATVASMMLEPGVSAWHRRWREFPIPNRFLGISEEQGKVYESIPFASQCAMRWVAHRDRMEELKTILGKDLLVLYYESFAAETEDTIERLREFLGLREPIPVPFVKTDSLDKWRGQLSEEEVAQIEKTVGFPPRNLSGDSS